MLLLAFDTATPAITVAVHDGAAALASWEAVDPRRHGELLAPAISGVLREAGADRRDLTGIAVGVGPGPFTGLRVGLVTARSLGHALDVPVYGACTLDVLAWRLGAGEMGAGEMGAGETSGVAGPFLVATDARRREVYWARYAGPATRTAGPAVARPDEVADRDLPAVGEGALRYAAAFPNAREPAYPSAVALGDLVAARLRRGGATLDPEPLYLRRPDASVPGRRKQVTPA